MTEIPMVDVLRLKAMSGNRLWLRFSDGHEGVWDMTPLLARQGEITEPLKQPEFFARVFVDLGAPTWPNGFDIDPINLYMRMRDAGLLAKTVAA